MKNNDWLMLVFCRGCGVHGTAHVRGDRTLEWPDIVHEVDCELAEPGDRREWHAWMAGAPSDAGQVRAGHRGTRTRALD